MHRFWNIVCIALGTTFLSTLANAKKSVVTPKESESLTQVKITPFQLELRAQYSSLSEELASSDLKNLTETHLFEFIQKNKDGDMWEGIQGISLYAEEEEMGTSPKRSLLRTDSRSLLPTTFFKVTYSGSMSFSGESFTSITRDLSDSMILNAFIGQGKLDYLSAVQTSEDEFLSSTNYAKAWISTDNDNTDGVKAQRNNKIFLIVAVIAGIAVFASILLAVFYIFYYKGSNSDTQPQQSRDNNQHQPLRKKTKSKKQKGSSPDIRLTATKSMSPPRSPKVMNHHHYHQVVTSQNNKKVDESVNTIDINSSFDMIAWKNTCRNTNTPFETDITVISNASPNKTIQVKIPNEVGTQRSSSSSSNLSRGMLSEHNSKRYDKRSSRRTRN
jgi:hypothetical protein